MDSGTRRISDSGAKRNAGRAARSREAVRARAATVSRTGPRAPWGRSAEDGGPARKTASHDEGRQPDPFRQARGRRLAGEEKERHRAEPDPGHPQGAPSGGSEPDGVRSDPRQHREGEERPGQGLGRVPDAVEKRQGPQPGTGRRRHAHEDTGHGDGAEQEREAAPFGLREGGGHRAEHQRSRVERGEVVRTARAAGQTEPGGERGQPDGAAIALHGRKRGPPLRAQSELRHRDERDPRQRQSEPGGAGQTKEPRPERRIEPSRGLPPRLPGKERGDAERRRRHLRAARQTPAARPQPPARTARSSTADPSARTRRSRADRPRRRSGSSRPTETPRIRRRRTPRPRRAPPRPRRPRP